MRRRLNEFKKLWKSEISDNPHATACLLAYVPGVTEKIFGSFLGNCLECQSEILHIYISNTHMSITCNYSVAHSVLKLLALQ